jgi:hypothetical protein
MRAIAHTKLRQHGSSRQPRTGRRWIVLTSTCAVILSLCLPGNMALGAGSLVGHCRLVLRVTMSPTRRHHRAISDYESSGTSSCTGSLGPWLMGSQRGWSTSEGTLENVNANVATQKRRVSTHGAGAFWAVAPRLAWFHPPLVMLTGAFHLYNVAGVIDLNGTGRLVPTRESPVASSFEFAGTATLTLNHPRARNPKRSTGTLTLEFAVRNNG